MNPWSMNIIARTACLLLGAALSLGAQAGEKLYLQTPAAYDKGAAVNDKIKKECNIEVHVPNYIKAGAKDKFSEIVSATKLDKTDGQSLSLMITNVTGVGGGAWSGPKGISIQGTLKSKGKVIGTFQARRTSSGGAWGGYKSTCSILERSAKALGKDVAAWLEKPTMNAALGELR
ncbi:MAG: hypothetical protein A2V92_04590 [Candidatus Muproteobacteria bacterium RBG_16_65_31]|uniref:DUF4410 domain-containing protein n=1 Tax=Candidatus Muproteobacteria bacterium RBG_16_65_31 TaxID=1817759 RepID=A0A1F6TEZ4_9PROT|nr:MAG: hypothetical protein A2V92_04590 [Candidatus Muproteobacteria bacterium RBG_16_65_31]